MGESNKEMSKKKWAFEKEEKTWNVSVLVVPCGENHQEVQVTQRRGAGLGWATNFDSSAYQCHCYCYKWHMKSGTKVGKKVGGINNEDKELFLFREKSDCFVALVTFITCVRVMRMSVEFV
jgi:hypothetical protein